METTRQRISPVLQSVTEPVQSAAHRVMETAKEVEATAKRVMKQPLKATAQRVMESAYYAWDEVNHDIELLADQWRHSKSTLDHARHQYRSLLDNLYFLYALISLVYLGITSLQLVVPTFYLPVWLIQWRIMHVIYWHDIFIGRPQYHQQALAWLSLVFEAPFLIHVLLRSLHRYRSVQHRRHLLPPTASVIYATFILVSQWIVFYETWMWEDERWWTGERLWLLLSRLPVITMAIIMLVDQTRSIQLVMRMAHRLARQIQQQEFNEQHEE